MTIFLLHSWNRWGWMAIVRTSGAVLHPSFDSLGWLLPLLATIGVIVAVNDRRARVTIVLLMVIVLQALTLFVVAKAQGADTPYMAYKMVYLAIYPLAILAAYALSRITRGARTHEPIGWLLAALLRDRRGQAGADDAAPDSGGRSRFECRGAVVARQRRGDVLGLPGDRCGNGLLAAPRGARQSAIGGANA